MEKRFWLGLGILLVLLGISLSITWGMSAIHKPIAEGFTAAADAALSGDLAQGVAQAQSARQRWNRFRNLTACVADHTPMDRVEELLAEMEVFAAAGDNEHFAACCNQLATAMTAMAESQRSTLYNFL